MTAISPGFHGRSLLTRQLGQRTHQILPVTGAAPVVSMALNLARGDAFMTVFTPTVTFAIGALGKPARDGHHDPCYRLMATFHKMNDEPGTEIVRCFGPGARRARVQAGSRISARRVALVLWAVALLLLVFILETARARTSATPALTSTCRWGRARQAPYSGMLLAVVAGFGLAERRTTSCLSRSDPRRDAAQS